MDNCMVMTDRVNRQQKAFAEALWHCRAWGLNWRTHIEPRIERAPYLLTILIFNDKNYKIMKLDFTALDQLRTIFTAEQFVLTGSCAANVLGLRLKEPKDMDIVLVNPTDECVSKLKEFSEKFPKKNKGAYENPGLIQICYNGLGIDFFISKEKYDDGLSYKGFILSPIDKIVAAKKSYKSAKHIMQLMNWRNNIIDDKEIKLFVDML